MFVAPVGGEGQSNRLSECRFKDRVISNFPRSAFEYIKGDDAPNTSVICGAGGPGWYPLYV